MTILTLGIGLIFLIPCYFASKYNYKNSFLPIMSLYGTENIKEIIRNVNAQYKSKNILSSKSSNFNFDNCDLIILKEEIYIIPYDEYYFLTWKQKHFYTPFKIYKKNEKLFFKMIIDDDKKFHVDNVKYFVGRTDLNFDREGKVKLILMINLSDKQYRKVLQ